MNFLAELAVEYLEANLPRDSRQKPVAKRLQNPFLATQPPGNFPVEQLAGEAFPGTFLGPFPALMKQGGPWEQPELCFPLFLRLRPQLRRQ